MCHKQSTFLKHAVNSNCHCFKKNGGGAGKACLVASGLYIYGGDVYEYSMYKVYV